MISTHEVSHSRARLWQQNIYILELFTVVGYLHTAGLKAAKDLIVPSVVPTRRPEGVTFALGW